MPCDERVGRGVVTWPCTLTPDHTGPHMSPDSQASVNERRRWDESQRAAADLAQFQGPAQTTAQRYTENPTPVPLSPGRRRLHIDCSARHGCIIQMADECPNATTNAPVTEGTSPGPVDQGVPAEGETVVAQGQYEIRPNQTFPMLHGQQPVPTCGASRTMGHGSNAVCARDKDHVGEHQDPTFYGQGIAWTDEDRVMSLPDRERALQEQREARKEDLRQQRGGTFEVDGVTYAGEPTRTPETIKAQVREGFEAPPGAPTKQREGDQVLPTPNDHPDAQSEVIADIEARRQVGISRYGTALQPFNGRDTLRDAYEEAMDLTVYLRSLLTMKEALRPALVEAVTKAVRAAEEAHGVLTQGEVAEVAVDAILDAALLFEPGPA